MWLQWHLHFSKRWYQHYSTLYSNSVAFKNCAPFPKCTTKIDGTLDDAEDLNLVMSIYNLIEYSSNYCETTGSLWFYSTDEATNFNADIASNNSKFLAIMLNY